MEKINLSETLRKSIHISSIAIPMIYRYVLHFNRKLAISLLIPLTVLFILVETFRIRHRTVKKIYQNLFGIILRKHELSDFTGAVYVMVSAIICIALFPRNIAFMALSFLAIGDTMAAVAGLSFGKRRLPGSRKSIEGSIGCFVSTFLFGFIYYIFDPDLGIAMSTLAVGALAATLAEGWKLALDDNLKIPIIAGIVMYFSNQIFYY
ncbi:MAG: SEC59/DGK1/VTE5 family protein [Candidatus Cloacimonetes bacterium]|nr:SEC59/DGK1/VTE5 family protein [Candidatus Cloacimonadota bacterium]